METGCIFKKAGNVPKSNNAVRSSNSAASSATRLSLWDPWLCAPLLLGGYLFGNSEQYIFKDHVRRHSSADIFIN